MKQKFSSAIHLASLFLTTVLYTGCNRQMEDFVRRSFPTENSIDSPAPVPTPLPLACDASLTTTYGGGSGTSGDPYTICSLAQWNYFATDTANWSKVFRLESDLDFTGVAFADFKMIGSVATPFSGTFRGNSHTIKNVSVSAGASATGLFLKTNGTVTISDLTLSNFAITSTGQVGGLVSSHGSSGSLTLTSISANNLSFPSAGTNSGGLVGRSDAPFLANQITLSSVSAAGTGTIFGGLIGRCNTDCTISNLTGSAITRNTVGGGNYSAGVVSTTTAGLLTLTDITLTASQMTALNGAGIVSSIGGSATFNRVRYNGNITSNLSGGGLFNFGGNGTSSTLSITDSSFNGTLYGGGGAGGLGFAFNGNVTVSRSFVKGTIFTGANGAAGLIYQPGDSAGKSVIIDDSYVAATVQSVDATQGYVAGLVFTAIDASITIRRTYFSANAIGNNIKVCVMYNQTPTGGATLTNVNYNSTACTQAQSSSGAIAGVTGLATASFQTATPFTGWSAANWVFTGGSNPKLIWEP